MFKKEGIIFGVLILFCLGFICAAAVENSLHLTIQTTNATGVTTGTFNFVFNISNSSDCANVVYSNSATLTTDNRGIISYYLEDVVLDFSVQYWLCYYRDAVLINATKLARTPYSFSLGTSTSSAIPTGMIAPFNLTECPTGWALANGSSGTPDLRGIFIRGSGTNSILKYANGSYFSSVLGTYGNDSFQGHWHYPDENTGIKILANAVSAGSGLHGLSGSGTIYTGSPYTDGTNGVPRNGSETSPAYYSTIYCVKTTEDSATSNSIWGVSGNYISIQNTSKNVGIGTSSPSSKLHVGGNVNITGNLSLGAGQIFYNSSANKYYYYNTTAWKELGSGTSSGESLWTNVSNVATYSGNVNITGNLTLGGSVTGQNVSRVRVMLDKTQTISNNVLTILQYNNESFDNLNEYDNATNYRFTATQAGYYFVDAHILLTSSAWTATQVMELALYKNGALNSFMYYHNMEGSITSYVDGSGSDIIYLNAGDYIDVRLFHNRGADTTTYYSAGDRGYSYLTITQLKQEIDIGGASSGVPAGMIAPFNLTSCPVGWIAADGNSGTPDLRGIFIRGSGTNSILKYANGSYFSSTSGTYRNDSFQDHLHWTYGDAGSTTSTSVNRFVGGATSRVSANPYEAGLYYNGTAGTPRSGNETSPAYYSTIYCVKTTEDSATSNTIWATSGNNVLLNNNSMNVNITSNLSVSGTGSTINQSDWIAPTFQNSWVNYGGSFSVAGYMKDSMGFVHLRGLVKSGTVAQCIFTLPAGYRPQYEEIYAVISNDVVGRVDISQVGCVYVNVGSNTWTSLDGITFRAYA